MARSINSPGVQITEKDLSEYIQPAVGTSVYAMGFAAQGPTDEVLLITSSSELEQTYGVPETPAEKYFHYTCREILNSSGTLLTTRLPYGSGNGAGFDSQYSALLYPVTQNFVTTALGVSGTGALSATQLSATTFNKYTIEQPNHVVLSQSEYDNIIQGNISWLSLSAGSFISSSNSINAGIVVLNTAQTTINEGYEGYYVTFTDNTDIGPGTNFTSVDTLVSLSSNSGFTVVPNTKLSFALSGTKESLGSGSISEIIEGIPTYDFGSNYYKDSLIMTVFKVRSSIYETGTLASSLVESYIGSLDPNKKTIAGTGPQTFFLEDLINNSSRNVKVLVNPNISKRTNWTSLSSADPSTAVRVNTTNKALYSVGTFVPTYTVTNKYVGDIVLKAQRALTLVESPELIDLDVIVDGGLSTISAVVSSETEFDDSVFVDTASLSSVSSNLVTRWRQVFNTFNGFVQNTRKDCVFISDPLRYIFVNGSDTKISSLNNYNFATNTYTPLKNLFTGIESNYAATYGNWVKVFDAYSDRRVWIPVSGFAAAAFARTDSTAQPWIAPAGLTRGVINNIVDIGFNPNQKQRDFLYPISINPVVFFNTDGFVIFGQKTLQTKPSAFDRVNVRRLFLVLEKSVQRSLRFFVFEPNSEFTRTRLKSTITPIFELAKNTEGLYDYLIVCDERNNTPDTIDRNELNVDIYIKPARAAEFILVNFIATRTGQNFQELI
jgi:hypothetical protein